MNQLVAGATTHQGTPVGGTELTPPVTSLTPMQTQEASSADDSVPSGPITEVLQTELHSPPSPVTVTDCKKGKMQNDVVLRRYPLRERRPPVRLDI